MKTIFVTVSLLMVLAMVGVLAAKELHQLTTAAGGSSAVIYATSTDATSPQQSPHNQQNLEHTVESAVQQVQPVVNDK